MNKPVLAVTGLTRSFTQGGETIEVLRGVDLTRGRGRDRRAARAVRLGQVDPAAGGGAARGRLHWIDPDRRRGSGAGSTRMAAPWCGATIWASSTSSITCCPTSTRPRMSCCPSLSATGPRAEADERATSLLTSLGTRPPADSSAEPAFRRRAAARRGRPRARQQAGPGAGGRADGQSRRGDRRCGARRIPPPRPRRGSAALVADA